MSWQIIIILQVIVSSFLTIFTRRLALQNRKLFFTIGVASYLAVGICGFLFALLFTHNLPILPTGQVWLYLVIEGLCIPGAWLLQYKIISQIGASNTVIISMLNNIGVAIMGIVFLGEGLSATFVAGTLCMVAGVWVIFRIRPDENHRVTVSVPGRVMLIVGMFILFSVGIFFEKKAINAMGVWDYAAFGWGMQFVGASLLWSVYGRREKAHITPQAVKNGLLLGAITSIAGVLFINALSIGSLSSTVIAASGKVAVTMLLAAILLKERNAMGRRIAAFILAIIGLWFVAG